MKKLILTLFVLLMGVSAAHAENASDIMKRTITGVVTVAIYEEGGMETVRGFGSGGDNVDEAYKKMLSLRGAVSSGSGFLVQYQGQKLIVTNNHVIANAAAKNSIIVHMVDQKKYAVEVLGADTFFDVAVLKFSGAQPDDKYQVLEFREAPAQILEPVYAIGNPLGKFPYSISNGIVSGVNRMVPGGFTGKYGYLQSTAIIAPGNSGGPLVDTQGKVLGINTQGFLEHNIYFALEGPVAHRLVKDIVQHGRVKRAYLGLVLGQEYQVVCEGDRCGEILSEPRPHVSLLIPGSPAEKALRGKEGYEILAINGERVMDLEEALGIIEFIPPGESVSMVLGRKGQKVKVSFKTQELDDQKLGTFASAYSVQAGFPPFVEKAQGVYFSSNVVQAKNLPKLQKQGNSRRGPNKMSTLSSGKKNSPKVNYISDPSKLPAGEIRILAAGFMEKSSMKVWKIKSLADLGVVVKLTALQGGVLLYPSADTAIFLHGSKRKDYLMHMLFY